MNDDDNGDDGDDDDCLLVSCIWNCVTHHSLWHLHSDFRNLNDKVCHIMNITIAEVKVILTWDS